MTRWVLGVLGLTAVGLAATYWQNEPPAGPPWPPEPVVARGQEPPAAAPPAVDVIDLALELELAPVKAEPFVPFD
jgi:hypothetical protein